LALKGNASTLLWRVEGKAEDITRSAERTAVYDILKHGPPEGMLPEDIAAALGKPPGTIRQLLWKMLREKTPCIKVDDRRRYHALPPSHNADNADNAGAGGGDESAWEADGSEDDGVTGGVTGESSDNAQETGTEPLAAWPDDTGVTGVTGVTGSTVASPLSKS